MLEEGCERQDLYCKSIVCVCSRVIKTDLEMEVMRYANRISSDAHKEVSKHATVGLSSENRAV